MPLLPRAASLLRNLFRSGAVAGDLDEEVEAYVGMAAAEHVRLGLNSDDARRRALAEIGGTETLKARVRERQAGSTLEAFLQDLAFGARLLARAPGFSLVAVATLALGVAASTAVFSVVDGVLLQPLPYPDADRVVFVGPTARDGRRHFSPPDFVEFRESASSFAAICAIQGSGLSTLSVGGHPTPVRAQEVTPGVLSVYGVRPHLGRDFQPSDDVPVAFEDRGAATSAFPPGVILISYRLWQDQFAGDPSVPGTMVELDFRPYEIIGVAPRGFDTLLPDEAEYRTHVDVWTPTRMDFRTMPRDASFLRVLARLEENVTVEQAQAEATVFAERQRAAHPIHREGGYEIAVDTLQSSLTGRHAAPIALLFGAAGLLLLIACANLASLLLSRSVERQREFAVRLALGASRVRLVRQLLTEASLYAMLGAGAAMLLAHWLTQALVRMAPASIPRTEEVGLRLSAFVFALVSALGVTALVALVPAVRLGRWGGPKAIQEAGRGAVGVGHRFWDHAFVVAEVALSVILLIGTALLVRTVANLLEVDAGFRPDRVLTANLQLAERRYPRYPRADARVRFARELTAEVSRLPGVESAALALVVPLSGQDAGHTFGSEAMAQASLVLPPAKYRPVTPGYFQAAGTALLAGRDFDWVDVEQDRLVSIVDERLAARAWPGESPLGKRLRIETWSTDGGPIHLRPLWTEVVGIAKNVRSGSLREDDAETVYVPYGLYAVAELSLMIRTSAEASLLAEPVRTAAARVDPDVALFDFRTMADLVAEDTSDERFTLSLIGAFALGGLLLALIGVYGVLSHSISLRQREIGVRMALGARPGDVWRLVLESGLRLIAVGVAVGLVASVGLTRFLGAQLFEVSPVDGAAFAAVAGLVLVVGLVACHGPARRASAIDPVTMLRQN